MANMESKELKPQEKQELWGAAEHTKPGCVFTPSVDINDPGFRQLKSRIIPFGVAKIY